MGGHMRACDGVFRLCCQEDGDQMRQRLGGKQCVELREVMRYGIET